MLHFYIADPHAVDGAVDEDQDDEEEEGRQTELQSHVLHRHGDLYGQQAEEGRELLMTRFREPDGVRRSECATPPGERF
jgi:hypothetical protein